MLKNIVLPLGVAALLVLAAVTMVRGNFTFPIAFGHSAAPTTTNANLVCITITNQSDSVVFCLACPVQVMSNGIWSGPPLALHQNMTKLAPRQSGVLVVDAGATNENTRVPVLWGYDYPLGVSRLRWMLEDLKATLSGRNPRGLGALYTNYLSNITPGQ